MTTVPTVRTFEVRHVQLARAAFAALAAIMITFSPDHSAEVGLAVFSGFAIATALVWFVAVWLVYPSGRRAPGVLLGITTLIAGMVTGIPSLRSVTLLLVTVIAWALITGIVELIAGVRARRDPEQAAGVARDAITIGILTIVLAVGLLFVPAQYALQYTIEEAGTFVLTGSTIAVGVFGGYAAIVAVYLAIAAFSPRPVAEPTGVDSPTDTPAGDAQ